MTLYLRKIRIGVSKKSNDRMNVHSKHAHRKPFISGNHLMMKLIIFLTVLATKASIKFFLYVRLRIKL